MTANDAVVLMTGATTCVVSIITVVANAVVRVRRQPMRRSTDTWVRADDTAADTTSTSTSPTG